MGVRLVALACVALACIALGAVALAAQSDSSQRPAPGVDQADAGQRTPARAGRLPAPEAPAGTAVLRGQVVALDTGTPIRRAQVRVSAQGMRNARLATTDAQGRFEIRELAAGRYTMTASKGGFVTLQYGQRRPGEAGTPLEVADGQTLDKLLVGLPRGSVISGRVTDEFGEPVTNASVIAHRRAYAGGARRLVPAGARDTTDDQGSYRLFGLPPGEYVVSATLRTGDVTDPGDDSSGYAPTYFPGTLNASEAEHVRVGLAEENGSVSFGLVATRLVRISGQVVSSTGLPPAGGSVVLTSAGARDASAFMRAGASRIDGSGTFRVINVAPGRYRVHAVTGGRANAEFARLDLTVGTDDVEGVMLVTAPAGRISGTVVTDTGEPLPRGSQPVQVVARPASPDETIGPGGGGGGGGTSAGRVSETGAFEVGNIADARYVRVNAPQDWTLKAVLVNGQDVTDVPIDVGPGQHATGVQVVITQKISSASGMITDGRNQPVLDASVVLFPVDERLRTFQSRFIRAARPDQEGRYRIADLPPGDYLAVAVQGLENGQAGDPEFLATVEELAERVTIREGEAKTLHLELGRR